MKRRSAVATIGVGLSALSRSALGQTTPVLRAAIGGAVESYALAYYAQQRGFFAGQGLDVQLIEVQRSQAILPAITSGQVEIGVTNTGAMAAAHVRGISFYLMLSGATYVHASPSAHAVVAKNSPMRSPRDVTGKTVGLNSVGDLLQAATMRWINRGGGDAGATKFYELAQSELAAALSSGRVDAAVMVDPVYGAVADHVKSIGFPYDAVNGGKPFQQTGTICNKDWADKNPELAKRVYKALVAASGWANTNPAAVTALLAAYTTSTVEMVAKSPRVRFATKNDPGLVQPVIELNAEFGFLTRTFSAAELYGGKTWMLSP